MTDLHDVIDGWAHGLGGDVTVERIREAFWYVRIPGEARRWIPLEIAADERSVKITSHVIITPDADHRTVYEFLLRRNHQARDIAFSLDGREAVICLVSRIANDDVDAAALDDITGRIVAETEETFRTILNLGFAARLKKR